MSPSPSILSETVGNGAATGGPKLIFVNRYFHPDHSATAQILTDLCVFLSQAGWHVEVVTSRGLYGDPAAKLPARQMFNGVSIHRVWTSRFGRRTVVGRGFDYLSFYLAAFFALIGSARRGDVIIAKTDPPLVALVAGAAAAFRGARLINWLQDLYPEIAAALGMPLLRGKLGGLLRRLRNRSLRGAIANVVIGAGMKVRVLDEGAPPGRVTVISNWTDDEEIQPQTIAPCSLRPVWGLGPDDFVVGYSGNLGRAHEVETLLAAARLLRERPDIRFLFVGGGHHSESLEKTVEAEGLAAFLFRPYQPKEHLSAALAVANVHWISLRPEMEGLVLPSKFYGIAAAARPVIAITDLAGELASLVRDNGCGLAIAPGDGEGLARAIASLSRDRAACEQMGERARALLNARFTRAGSLARWEQLLRNLARPG